MNQKLSRKTRLLIDHPNCCFCGGNATTVDHVPSRQLFADRQAPEGFEFPACAACNNGSGKLEQVVSLYLKLTDQTGRKPDESFSENIRGVFNNNPAFMPIVDVSTSRKKRAVKEFGLVLPEGTSASRAPVLRLPPEAEEAFEHFAKRLSYALFYKHLGIPKPEAHFVKHWYIQEQHRSVTGLMDQMKQMMPNSHRATRTNADLGDQFWYLWYAEKGDPYFAYAAQFNRSYLFFGVVAPEEYEGALTGA